MQILNRRPSRPVSKPRYNEKFDDFKFSKSSSLDFIPDDDIPDYEGYKEMEPLKAKKSNFTENPISEQLQRIEERLAKLEGMLHELMVRDNQSVTPIMQQPQPMYQTPVMESINTPPKGSMLSEIQNVIAQQEAAAGSMGQMGGDIVSSVATMSPAAYDDDIPNIIGLD